MDAFAKKRFFIIEDDASNLAIISAILRRESAKIFFDTWGLNTVEQIIKFLPIHAIFLDLNLPRDVNGYDVARQIRQNEALQEIPIVVVTAADVDAELSQVRRLRLNGLIAKPIRAKTFVPAVSAILSGETVWDV